MFPTTTGGIYIKISRELSSYVTGCLSNLFSRHLIQLNLMVDGHFGLQRFAKVDDPDDVSLLGDSGFFPQDSEYKKYVLDAVITEQDEVHIYLLIYNGSHRVIESSMFQL